MYRKYRLFHTDVRRKRRNVTFREATSAGRYSRSAGMKKKATAMEMHRFMAITLMKSVMFPRSDSGSSRTSIKAATVVSIAATRSGNAPRS